MDSPTAYTQRLGGLVLSVTPENVLRIRDTLKEEVMRLQTDYNAYRVAASSLPELGPDPVSKQAKAGFDPKLKAVVDQFAAIIAEVQDAVLTLTVTAQSYGLTEDDIASSAHGIGSDTSGARGLITSLAADQSTPSRLDLPGPVANTPWASSKPNPAPNGVDTDYIRRVLNPTIQIGMTRP